MSEIQLRMPESFDLFNYVYSYYIDFHKYRYIKFQDVVLKYAAITLTTRIGCKFVSKEGSELSLKADEIR